MTPAAFLKARGPAWQRVEELVARTGRRGVSALTENELHELTRLYPSVAVDVARARMYQLDRGTQQRINRLAIATHGLLYKRRHRRVLPVVSRFFVSDYPRLFRRLLPYVAFAAALFFVAGLGTYVSVRIRPSLAYVFVPGRLDTVDGEAGLSPDDMAERFRRDPNASMAAFIMSNNASVAFMAFAFGITAGIGTCYILLFNGMLIGGFVAHFANHGLGYVCWSFLTAHGVLEIMAIFIAAGAGLRMGLSLAMPGRLTRLASLRAGAREAVMLVLGTVPMFIVAGVIEGFVTPGHASGKTKIALGLLVGAVTLAYLFLAGRRRAAAAGVAAVG